MNAFSQKIQPMMLIMCRVFLGLIFIASGAAKFANLEQFYQAAQGYNVLPPMLLHFYSGMLPWLEVLGGVYLLFGAFTRFAAGLISLPLISFIIAIGMALSQGSDIDCGCFLGGSGPSTITPELLLRDIGLLLLSLYLVWAKGPSSFSVDRYLENKPQLSA